MSLETKEREILKETPTGLTSAEVEARVNEGKVNKTSDTKGKSYLKIVADNLFTFFNLMYALITVIIILLGQLGSLEITNLGYLAVVIPNILLAIIQEIRAKIAVRKLSVTTDPKATVVRDGVRVDVDSSKLVVGDLMCLELGRQILCDAIVVSGMCETNESMLTGESEPIKKQAGDRVFAGSFVVSGSVMAEIDRVGNDNYAHKIEKAAKKFKAPASNLFRDLNRLIMTIGFFMIPLTAAVLLANRGYYGNWVDAIEMTCGSVIGMIPAGVYLLITITLSLSVMSLAKKRTQVQDMYSIEMLASADVLCLDKTGTITDGTMEVVEVYSHDGTDEERIGEIIGYLEGAEQGINPTSKALSARFGRLESRVVDRTPFSSSRKYYDATIEGVGRYAIGAPHFVPCPVSEKLDEVIAGYASDGKRVLLLARLNEDGTDGEAVALIAIADRIRPNAKETIEGFQSQGVTVKVISGDHAETVATIAAKVGIKDADKFVSCETLSDEELVALADECAVFGRVTPEQKVLLIKTLKEKGHTVAMTGDGVNDTLALKESNCAIAMADGSEMARAISQIVLMDSDFGALPGVVREGRRCINNVRQSAVLFLMKTIFTVLVSLFAVVTVSGYPFEPKHYLLLELFIIGISSVLLALEPNNERIKGSFLDSVVIRSLPCSLAMFIPTLVTLLIGKYSSGISSEARGSVAMCVIVLVGFINLVYICRPFTKWRIAVAAFVGVALALIIPTVTILESVGITNLFGVFNVSFGFVDAGENLPFLFGMLALGLVFASLPHVFRRQIQRWTEYMSERKNRSRT